MTWSSDSEHQPARKISRTKELVRIHVKVWFLMDLHSPEHTEHPVTLKDKIFYIVGVDKFQNSLIAEFLERQIGATSIVCEDIFDAVFQARINTEGSVKLILWNCRGKDAESLLLRLGNISEPALSQAYMVLFNVRPGIGIEERCVWKGIRGFFYEDDPIQRFLKGVLTVLKGELWLSREIVSQCMLEGRGKPDTAERKRTTLTARQVEILSLVAVGSSNDEIAEALCISPHTVKTHLYRIFRKIKVPNRLQAALWTAKNLEHVISKYY